MDDKALSLEGLFEQIRTGKDHERRRARLACMAFGEAAVPGLIALLQDENAAVRHAAINTLGWIASPLAADALRERVYNEPDIYARGQAIVALAHCAKDGAVADLLTMLDWQEKGRQECDKRLCEYAAEQLLALKLTELPVELEKYAIAQIYREDARDKVFGILILEQSSSQTSIIALEKALNDFQIVPFHPRRYGHKKYIHYGPSPIRVNAFAKAALGKLSQNTTIEEAIVHLETGDIETRKQAIISIWYSDDKRWYSLLWNVRSDQETDANGASISDFVSEILRNWVRWYEL